MERGGRGPQDTDKPWEGPVEDWLEMKCKDDILSLTERGPAEEGRRRFPTGWSGDMKEQIILGEWTEERLDRLLKEASAIEDPGARVDFLSRRFLNSRYKGSTLIGDRDRAEVFVVNLEGLDCFTFIDYIEAMRRSGSFSRFKETLKNLRYQSGDVAFEKRNHFFTDWKAFSQGAVVDVTKEIGAEKCREALKRLNEKEDGTLFLPGLDSRVRDITYIPSTCVDEKMIRKMKTGDYIGIYSAMEGLDVSHVGIVIKRDNAAILRHASSPEKHGRVVDEDLKKYIAPGPGVIVLRPKA